MMTVKGRVTSAELCSPLAGVMIQISFKGKASRSTQTDQKGFFNIDHIDDSAILTFQKEGFTTKSISVQSLQPVIRMLETRTIGYQKKLWFYPGDQVDCFIHSPTTYTATLFRHGLTKEKVKSPKKQKPSIQNLPEGFFVESGLNWEPTLTYTIPKKAKPGLYSLSLKPEEGEEFAIPFIVSTPPSNFGGKTKILVLASTTTWQSYNLWGGRSRYRNFETEEGKQYMTFSQSLFGHLKRKLEKKTPSSIKKILIHILGKGQPSWKFQKLSIRRPFTNCLLEDDNPNQPFTNHLAASEWRLLAWLERENIEYDMISGYELHENADLLSQYKGIILSSHCEYWSKEMFQGLKKYHQNHGLWILNLSGNSIFREIEFFKDGSTRCTSLSFTDSCEDETQVLGVRFTDSDYGTCAPFQMIKPNHWAFRNISIKENKSIFGKDSLNRMTPKTYKRYDPGRPGLESDLQGTGASGWETDKLSKTAPDDFVVIAKGMNKYGGADMVVRDPQGQRSGIFSASSVTFVGSLLIDETCSQIVKNVIQKVLRENP